MNILIVRVTCRGDVEIWWKLDMDFTIFNIFFLRFPEYLLQILVKWSRRGIVLPFFFSRFKHKVLQSWQRVVINAIWDMLFNVLFSVQRQISVFGNLFGTSTRCFRLSVLFYKHLFASLRIILKNRHVYLKVYVFLEDLQLIQRTQFRKNHTGRN